MFHSLNPVEKTVSNIVEKTGGWLPTGKRMLATQSVPTAQSD